MRPRAFAHVGRCFTPPARGLRNLVLSSDHLEAFRPRVYVGAWGGGGGGVEGSAAFLSEPTAGAAKGGRWAQEETSLGTMGK